MGWANGGVTIIGGGGEIWGYANATRREERDKKTVGVLRTNVIHEAHATRVNIPRKKGGGKGQGKRGRNW